MRGHKLIVTAALLSASAFPIFAQAVAAPVRPAVVSYAAPVTLGTSARQSASVGSESNIKSQNALLFLAFGVGFGIAIDEIFGPFFDNNHHHNNNGGSGNNPSSNQ